MPIRRASFSTVIVLGAGMERPFEMQDAMLQPVASWGDRDPHGGSKALGVGGVNGRHPGGSVSGEWRRDRRHRYGRGKAGSDRVHGSRIKSGMTKFAGSRPPPGHRKACRARAALVTVWPGSEAVQRHSCYGCVSSQTDAPGHVCGRSNQLPPFRMKLGTRLHRRELRRAQTKRGQAPPFWLKGGMLLSESACLTVIYPARSLSVSGGQEQICSAALLERGQT